MCSLSLRPRSGTAAVALAERVAHAGRRRSRTWASCSRPSRTSPSYRGRTRVTDLRGVEQPEQAHGPVERMFGRPPARSSNVDRGAPAFWPRPRRGRLRSASCWSSTLWPSISSKNWLVPRVERRRRDAEAHLRPGAPAAKNTSRIRCAFSNCRSMPGEPPTAHRSRSSRQLQACVSCRRTLCRFVLKNRSNTPL